MKLPAIAGGVPSEDGIIWNAHPALVSDEDWQRIQALLAKQSRAKSTVVSDTLLRGVIYHGYGRRMYPQWQHANSVFYYRCANASGGNTSIVCTVNPRVCSVLKVNSAALTTLESDIAGLVSPDEALATWNAKNNVGTITRQRTRLLRERQKALETAERAEALYLPGKRDAVWLASQDAIVGARVTEIDAELRALATPPKLVDLERLTRCLGDVRN